MPITLTVKPHGAAGPGTGGTVAGDASDGFDASETAEIIKLMPNADDTVDIAGKTYRNNSGTLEEVKAPSTGASLTAPMALQLSPELVKLGGTTQVGGKVDFVWNLPVSDDKTTSVVQVGPGVFADFRAGGDGYTLPMGQPQVETGATSYMHRPSSLIAAGLTAGFRYNTGGFIINPQAFFGFGLLTGDLKTGHLSGSQLNTSYCNGIFKNGQTGSCIPLPAKAQPGADNDLTESSHNFGFVARAALLLGYDLGSVTPYLGAGVQAVVGGPGDALVGGLVTGGVSIPLGEAAPVTTATPPPPPAEPRASASGTVGVAMSLDDDGIRALGGLGPDAKILGVQFDNLPEDTSSPYEVPADKMTSGAHVIRIRYRTPTDTKDRFKFVDFMINEPTKTSSAPSAANATLVTKVSRPAPVLNVAPAPLTIGKVEVTSALPKGSVYAVFVDGNEVGTIALQPTSPGADHVVPITIPAATSDTASANPHQIGLRLRQPGVTEVRLNDSPLFIGPAYPTLSAASVTSTATYYVNDSISIRVTSDQAGPARIKVGNYMQDVTLTAGVNNITLTGKPGTWDTGAKAGERKSFEIHIQPLDGTNLVGADTTVGSVTIQRGWGGGGGGGGGGKRKSR